MCLSRAFIITWEAKHWNTLPVLTIYTSIFVLTALTTDFSIINSHVTSFKIISACLSEDFSIFCILHYSQTITFSSKFIKGIFMLSFFSRQSNIHKTLFWSNSEKMEIWKNCKSTSANASRTEKWTKENERNKRYGWSGCAQTIALSSVAMLTVFILYTTPKRRLHY